MCSIVNNAIKMMAKLSFFCDRRRHVVAYGRQTIKINETRWCKHYYLIVDIYEYAHYYYTYE